MIQIAPSELVIEYDTGRDIVTIFGVKYSGELFRPLGFYTAGTWLRIQERNDGVLTVLSVPDGTERIFDLLTGQGLHG